MRQAYVLDSPAYHNEDLDHRPYDLMRLGETFRGQNGQTPDHIMVIIASIIRILFV